MENYHTNRTAPFKHRFSVVQEAGRLYGVQDFSSKSIACVVAQEETFQNVFSGLEFLGFDVACSSCLDTTFKVVSEDPQDWAMIIVRLDQPKLAERLESYIRLIRMMDFRVPIVVMNGMAGDDENSTHRNRFADCTVDEPRTIEALSQALRTGADADIRWGSRFTGLRSAALDQFPAPQQA